MNGKSKIEVLKGEEAELQKMLKTLTVEGNAVLKGLLSEESREKRDELANELNGYSQRVININKRLLEIKNELNAVKNN